MISRFSRRSSRSAVAGASRLLAAAALAVAPVSAATILNASFESPAGTTPQSPVAGSTAITGWTVTTIVGPGTDDIQYGNNADFPGINASDGAHYLDLTGGTDNKRGKGVISDPITVFSGVPYTLNFDVGELFYAGTSFGSAEVEVWIDGISVGSFLNTASLFANGTDWQTMSYGFTPITNSITLKFTSSTSLSSSITFVGLDNIKLTAVPEPAGVGTLLVGLGMFGFAARRRRSHLSA